MAKLLKLEQKTPQSPEYSYYCPGCDDNHWFKTTGTSPCWVWNGDMEKPSVSPSIRVKSRDRVCHFFIRDGEIVYLADCTHMLAGQTVPMTELDN